MTEVFNMILQNVGRAFTEMSEFQLFEGLSLLEFLVVLLLLHVIVSLFFSHLPQKSGADKVVEQLKRHTEHKREK